MKNSTKGFVAGAAGVGLLLGASTFAIWSDNATVDGAEIAAGNVEVSVEHKGWEDDRTGQHIGQTLESFKVVPGDSIKRTDEVKVDLDGDNMVANLQLVGGALDGDLSNALTIDYQLQNSTGVEVLQVDESGLEVQLTPEDVKGTATHPNTQFVVETTIHFDANKVKDRELTQTEAKLDQTSLQLRQINESSEGSNN
ncbi:alternate-type signal peptide domain-containing protein [Yaniella halotolerans]|uniref:alternate-type signal peptide domain-containing protein n=1 Tax=Yaniella halotolerans TaxID=225453 RepID=UPI0003B37065|nr:alternate-type signal peptide domain-containing protein [Yaniella halotolerans]